MTVSIILAGKGREVVTIEPNANLAAAVALLAEKRIGALLIPAPTAASPASSPNATLCARSPRAARRRLTSR